MSTSVSTVTLSDVYTLSWDLPPSSGFEAVPDEEEEDNKVIPSFPVEPQESTLVLNSTTAHERSDSPAPLPDNTNASEQEANHSSSVDHSTEPDPVSELDVPVQLKHGWTGSEHFDNPESPKDSTFLQEDESKQTESPPADRSKPETPLEEESVEPAAEKTELPLSVSTETQEEPRVQPQQPENEQPGSSAPEPPQEPGLAPSEEQAASTSILPSASAAAPPDASTNAAVTPALLSSVQPSKAAALASNPFKIQKVKSSDLKSFQRILSDEEVKPGQVDRANSLGTGLNLSVPMDSLEIISDSEEGDAAATPVPDWLKEGEFVTVGANKSGTVQYVGPTDFAEGTWVGVELEVPAGEHNKNPHLVFTSLKSSKCQTLLCPLQEKMMAQLAGSTTSTVTLVTVCWYARAGLPAGGPNAIASSSSSSKSVKVPT